MTVEVEAGDMLYTGSSVIQLTYIHTTSWLPGASVVSRIRGEAVSVDLGERGVLFLLLTDQEVPRQALDLKPSSEWFVRNLSDFEAKAETPFKELPMLVRFRDIKDPKTVELVDPNNLAKSFGPGVDLKRVIIETTKEPITTGIEKRLPWLAGVYSTQLDGARLNNSTVLSNTLNSGNFKIGVK